MERKKILARAVGMSLTFSLLAAPFISSLPAISSTTAEAAETAVAAPAADGGNPQEPAAENRSIVLTGTIQSKAGAKKDWDPSDQTTRMQPAGHDFYTYKMKLPAGTYYYKISVNGSWAENYGLDGNFDGANVQLTLPKAQEVTFYYNDRSHHIADSTSYTFLTEDKLPRISGSFGEIEDPVMRDQTLDHLSSGRFRWRKEIIRSAWPCQGRMW